MPRLNCCAFAVRKWHHVIFLRYTSYVAENKHSDRTKRIHGNVLSLFAYAVFPLSGKDTVSREATVKIICPTPPPTPPHSPQPPSEKRSILKGNNLLPFGSISFILERTPFQKGISVQEDKQEVTKVVSLIKNGRKYRVIRSP